MAAYAIDLREKILKAWKNKEGSKRELAKGFSVSLSFIGDFLRRYRETGEIGAKPQGGERRSKLKDMEQKLLKIIVTETNDIYLREIQAAILERTEIAVSRSSLSRTLNRLKLKRQKTLVATEQGTQPVKQLR